MPPLQKQRQDRLKKKSPAKGLQKGNNGLPSPTKGLSNGLSRSSTAPSAIGGALMGSGGARLRTYPVGGALISAHQAHNEFTASSSAGAVNRLAFRCV